MEFFKSSAKTITNEGVVEGVDYVVHVDKNGVRTRVLNLENPKYCRRTGIIELEPVKRSKNHDNKLLVSRIYDAENDITIGIPAGVDLKTGELKFKRITIPEDRTFDLSKITDAQEWAVLKHHKDIDVDGTKIANGIKVKYKVYDKEEIATKFLAERSLFRKAIDIAEGLHGRQLVDFAIQLGIPSGLMSQAELQMQVIKTAEKKPKEFMAAWDNPDKYQISLVKKALSLGVLTNDPLMGIMYNGLPMGTSEQQAVMKLKENVGLAHNIEKICQEKSGAIEESLVKNVVHEILDDKDAEIKRLKEEAEAYKKKLQEIADEKFKQFESETENQKDEEFMLLLTEAKELKIKGAHLVKDKETLRQKIKDALEQKEIAE